MDGLFSSLIESFKKHGALFLFLLMAIICLYGIVEENRNRDIKRIEDLEKKIDLLQEKYNDYIKHDNKAMMEIITKNNQILEQVLINK